MFCAGGQIVPIVVVEKAGQPKGQALVVEDGGLDFLGHVVFDHCPGPLFDLPRSLGMVDAEPVEAGQELEVGKDRDVDLRAPQLFATGLAEPLDRGRPVGLQIVEHRLRIGVESIAGYSVERGQRHVAVEPGYRQPAFEVGAGIADTEAGQVHRLHRHHRPGMGPAQMIAIAADIFDWQLPVGVQHHLLGFADQRGAAGQSIEPDVEIEFGIAEIVFERRRGGIEIAEDQPFVFGDLRHRHEPEFAAVEFAKIGLVFKRDPRQRAIRGDRPAVVVAGEGPGIAAIGAADAVAAVSASVEEGLYRAVLLPDDDDVVFAHVGAEEVIVLRDLAGVGKEQPASAKDALKLLAVDRLAGIDRA